MPTGFSKTGSSLPGLTVILKDEKLRWAWYAPSKKAVL